MRIITLGDPAEAARWVGFGRRLLAQAKRLAVRGVARSPASGVWVRVETTPTEKIWVSAEGGGGYHFVHTTETPLITMLGSYGVTIPLLWGSGVHLPLPVVKSVAHVLWDRPPRPVASAVEGGDESPWRVLTERTIEEHAELTAFADIDQVQLLPLPTFAAWGDDGHSFGRLLHSQAGETGQVTGAGVASPLPALGFRDADVMYDAAPARVQGRRAHGQAPDSDWYHEAAMYRISSDDYGPRLFIVMADASGTLHCWPSGGGPQLPSAYDSQAIKTNIPPERARSVVPPYPDWVHRPPPFREQWTEQAPRTSPEPRYAWAFHPSTPRVSCVAIRRQPTPSALYRSAENTSTHEYTETLVGTPFRVRLGDRLAYGKPFPSDAKIVEAVSDRPGLVEFDLGIAITGQNAEDFEFTMTLKDHLLANESTYPIAVGYLAPVEGGWNERGIPANAGDRIDLMLKVASGAEEEGTNALQGGRRSLPLRHIAASFQRAGTPVLELRLWRSTHHDRVHLTPSLDGYEELDGWLSDINIPQLTFVAVWEKLRYQRNGMVDQRKASVSPLWNIPDEPMADGYLLDVAQETGVRVYHRGRIVIERRYGAELSILSSVDAPAEDGEIPLSVDEVATAWHFLPNLRGFAHTPNFTSTSLFAVVGLSALLKVANSGYPAATAATEQEDVHDLLEQAFIYGDEMTPVFSHASLANLWSGYTPEWFYASVVPYLDRCWKWMRALLAHTPDPADLRYRRVDPIAATAALSSQLAAWHRPLWGWFDPPSTFGYPHVDGWPVGESIYQSAWVNALGPPVAFRAVADHRGFLAVWIPVVYATQPLPLAVEYSLLNDALPASVNPDLPPGTAPDTSGVHWRYFTNPARYVDPPPPAAIGQDIIDVILHENGGETSHRAAYTAAYRHDLLDSALFGTPSIERYPDAEGDSFVYWLRWPGAVHGVLQRPSMRVLLEQTDTPRANGASFFE